MGFEITKNVGIMLFFALVMLAASYSMITNKKRANNELQELRFNYPLIGLEGAVVSILTGVVGAGGGFLIIPAMVLLARLPIKMAVGTSLLIIVVKALVGFMGNVSNIEVEWVLLWQFTALSVVGIFIGTYLHWYLSFEVYRRRKT